MSHDLANRALSERIVEDKNLHFAEPFALLVVDAIEGRRHDVPASLGNYTVSVEGIIEKGKERERGEEGKRD
jgi:hypothetical protein